MSETMTQGVLRMPYEMVMSDRLSRRQFYDRAQQMMDERDALSARAEELEAHLRTIAKSGGTLDQARELAAKGIERAALVTKDQE